jgi:hypothetical protein
MAYSTVPSFIMTAGSGDRNLDQDIVSWLLWEDLIYRLWPPKYNKWLS